MDVEGEGAVRGLKMWNCGEGEMRAEKAGSVELGGGITIPSPRVWPMNCALIISYLSLHCTGLTWTKL